MFDFVLSQIVCVIFVELLNMFNVKLQRVSQRSVDGRHTNGTKVIQERTRGRNRNKIVENRSG